MADKATAEHDRQGLHRFVQARTGAALARYIRFVMATSRLVAEPEDFAAVGIANQPFILAFWHGQFMLVPALKPPEIKARSMVARHEDAELLAAALSRFDMDLIRGAGAGARGRDRGGAQALRGALSALQQGYMVALTADVPPGPARKAGLGIVTLARISGRPILPLAVASSRYRSLDTWSRMTINLPFSTIGVCLGEPIFVPRELDAEGLERSRLQAEVALNAATERAYALAGADPARATPRPRSAATRTIDPDAPAPAPGIALRGYRAATSALRPVAPLILARRARQGKEDLSRRGERLGRASRPRPDGALAWVHAASVGETNAILPLMSALQQARPGLKLLLTTGTVTSAELAAGRLGPDALHQYVPLDAPQLVRRFLEHWRPDIALFTESEVWPNLLLETSARRIPLILVNGRMSKTSYRKWRGRPGSARPLFGRFDLVLAQNEKLAERFAELGARRSIAVGNLKLDAPPPPVDVAALSRLEVSLGGRTLLLAASTHEGEDELVAAAHRALAANFPDLLTIIAPRHPERGADIGERLGALGLTAARRSQGAMPEPGADMYIADTIGELGTLYSLAPVAFIGGSLVPRGGQNPIEAVKLDAAVVTGPHWENFRDTYRELIRRKGASEVRSADELAATVKELLADRQHLQEMLENASAALAGMTGALERTVAAIEPYLPGQRPAAAEPHVHAAMDPRHAA
jgi:3-deoxy-D-manno-octulosonic-acid transferase